MTKESFTPTSPEGIKEAIQQNKEELWGPPEIKPGGIRGVLFDIREKIDFAKARRVVNKFFANRHGRG